MFGFYATGATQQPATTAPPPAPASDLVWPPPILGRGGAPDATLTELFNHYADDHPLGVSALQGLGDMGLVGPIERVLGSLDGDSVRGWAADQMAREESALDRKRCERRGAAIAEGMCDDSLLPDGGPAASRDECERIWREGRDAQTRTEGTTAQITRTDGSQWSQQGGGQLNIPLVGSVSGNVTHQSNTSTADASGTTSTVAVTQEKIRGYEQECVEAARAKYAGVPR